MFHLQIYLDYQCFSGLFRSHPWSFTTDSAIQTNTGRHSWLPTYHTIASFNKKAFENIAGKGQNAFPTMFSTKSKKDIIIISATFILLWMLSNWTSGQVWNFIVWSRVGLDWSVILLSHPFDQVQEYSKGCKDPGLSMYTDRLYTKWLDGRCLKFIKVEIGNNQNRRI